MAFTVPIVLCIDAEPDASTPDPNRPDPWAGFEATLPLAHAWRGRFEAATRNPVSLSWFVRADPQVARVYGSASWGFEHYRRTIGALIAAGDEIGLHVHPSRWGREEGTWIEDFSSESWIEECVSCGVAAYRVSLGARCRSMRIGSHWMSHATADLLERLDVEYDLTLEPGARERDRLGRGQIVKGTLPDFGGLARTPYRKALESYRDADDERSEGLWMLPVSTIQIDGASPESVRQASDDGAYLRLGLWYAPAAFQYVFETCLRELNPPCLVLVMRSNMPLDPSMLACIQANVDWLLSHPLRRRFQLSRPDQVVERVVALAARNSPVSLAPGSDSSPAPDVDAERAFAVHSPG